MVLEYRVHCDEQHKPIPSSWNLEPKGTDGLPRNTRCCRNNKTKQGTDGQKTSNKMRNRMRETNRKPRKRNEGVITYLGVVIKKVGGHPS